MSALEPCWKTALCSALKSQVTLTDNNFSLYAKLSGCRLSSYIEQTAK